MRAAVLIAPWAFVLGLGGVWLGLLLPRVPSGSAPLVCLTLIAGLALISFIVAVVTFTQDVLGGRWPPADV